MPFANEERVYVASKREIVLLFLVFSIILIILYPKDVLEQQVLKETSNYDLSISYLENMLRQDPKNESLMYMLAQQTLRAGKRDRAYSLLQTLLNSKDLKIKQDSNILAYKLAKEEYFSTQDIHRKETIKIDLKKIFVNIVNNKYYTNEELQELYEESLFLGLDLYTYTLLREMISNDPLNITLLTKAYYLTNKLNKITDIEYYLHLLEHIDTKNQEKWFLEEYNYFLAKKDFLKVEILLKQNAKLSPEWKEILARFYLTRKNYTQSSLTYTELFETSSTISKKKEYFIEALRSMQADNNMQGANDFANKHQNLFLNDSAMRILLLKFYLGTNNPKSAAELSKKILYNEIK